MQFLTILAFAAACVAGPIAAPAALYPYVKPKSTDSRSPCPMLNTLANHGYLPRNGRNITAQEIGDAIFQSTNWDAQFGLLPANGALKGLGKTVLDLEDLSTPAGGEHPASLTRKDASSGDSTNVDTARVMQLLADSNSNFLTVDSVAKSRNRVDKISKPPPTPAELGVGQGEAALMMMLMRDDYVSLQTSKDDLSTLRMPKDRTSVWLLQEKFPTAQGWRPSKEVIQFADLAPINAAIVASQAAQKGDS